MKHAAQDKAVVRSALYDLLSLAFAYPEKGTATHLKKRTEDLQAADLKLGRREIGTRLTELSRLTQSLDDEALLAQYVDTFGHSVSSHCPPYEGEYGQAHIFQKAQTLADLNSFYQAFGMKLNPELKDRPDHLSVEMEFMGLLALKEAYARARNHGRSKVSICRRAQRRFLDQHLSTWVKGFARRLNRKAAPGGIYLSLSALLDVFIDCELHAFRIDVGPIPEITPTSPPEGDVTCEVSSLSPTTSREG
ncbi:MAG: molecular chaperone [Dehalococcoidia bacterium]